MKVLELNETCIEVARDTHDGRRREEWTFHQDGSVRAYSKATRESSDDEWTYTLLTFPDSPAIFGDLWKDPPGDVLDEATALLTPPAVAAPMVRRPCSVCGTMARPGSIHCRTMVDPFDYPSTRRA